MKKNHLFTRLTVLSGLFLCTLPSFGSNRPNVVFVLADQMRVNELPVYGGRLIKTPGLDRLAREGVVFDQAISPCPMCTPYRGMLLTGRHPQSTGLIENNIRTRHDEISVADAFGKAGYRTGWIGKWHLYSGPEPTFLEGEYIPDGRDRLGFDYFRGYNYHVNYMNGEICADNGKTERWKGYETEGLLDYFDTFLDQNEKDPFCVFISPHQPHHGGRVRDGKITEDFMPSGRLAPASCMERVPEDLVLPPNVDLPEGETEKNLEAYRDYLGMIVAIDDMVADVTSRLKERGLLENTIIVFTSDHGSMMGAHGQNAWQKRLPYEESIHVPLIVRFPGKRNAGARSNSLVSPVDFFPTLASLCSVSLPETVEGKDLSGDWLSGDPSRSTRDALLTMFFSNLHFRTGLEWKGIRTQEWNYYRFLTGDRKGLYNIRKDPYMLKNLSGKSKYRKIEAEMEARLQQEMAALGDELLPAPDYKSWFDDQRQVIGNARGPLPPGYEYLHQDAVDSRRADPMKDAAMVCDFANNSGLKVAGAVRTGVILEGEEKSASLARGGDGFVAVFNGGYLTLEGDMSLTGKQMTLLLRVCDPMGAWDSPLLARKDASDPLANLLFCMDGRQKPRDYYWKRDGEVRHFGATPYYHLFHEAGDDRAISGSDAILEYCWRTAPVPAITGRSEWKDANVFVPGEIGEQAAGAYLPLCAPMDMVGLDDWHDVVIRFDGPNLEMFIDGVLIDEEWPWGGLYLMETPLLIGAGYENGKIRSGFRGQIDHLAIWDRALSEDEIVALSGGAKHVAQRELEILGPIAPSPQYWRPRGYNTYAGDVMMLTHDGRLSVFYLFDRRHHTAKWRLGAHQYGHFSSSNLVDWTEHKLAIPLDNQWEAAIGTGEFIVHEDEVYCFYTDCGVRCEFPDKPYKHKGSGIFVATSRDGIHFTKQDEPILEGGDCSVFQDDQTGLFYLVKNSREGTVAHVSKDLRNWDPEPKPFFTGARGTCPHWFKWNDWYYLKAGNAFFQSRQPLGPWTPIRSKTLSTKIAHVKTAPWKDGRRIGGDWIGDGGWGGDLVIRELVQHDDGNLTWKFLPELIPATGNPLELTFAALGEGASLDGKSIRLTPPSPDKPVFGAFDKLPDYFRLTATVCPGKGVRQLGLCVRGESDYESGVELRFDPQNRVAGYTSPGGKGKLGKFDPRWRHNLKDVTGLDEPFTIDLIATRFGLVDLCINEERCMITREKATRGNRLFFFAEGGEVMFENVVIRPLLDPTPETAMSRDYGLTR